MDLTQFMYHICSIVSMLWTFVSLAVSQYSEDSCDWILWGSAVDTHGVRLVQPSCAEGLIQWKHPYGAIRIAFGQPFSKTFEACFIAKTVKTTVKISEEGETSLKHLTLLSGELVETEREICVQSEGRSLIVIFLEAVLDTNSGVGSLQLHYDVRNMGDIASGLAMEDCRPCSDEEIVQAVCYSDFVVKGRIEDVLHMPAAEESHIEVALDKVYRQSHQIFKRSIQITRDDDMNIENQSINNARDSSKLHRGSIIVPHKCRTSKGDGTFVFMGKVRLKRAHLSCAPRIEDFERIWKQALRTGTNICVLG